MQGKCLYPAAGGKIFDIQQPTGDEKPLEKRSLKGSKSEKFACGAIVFFCVWNRQSEISQSYFPPWLELSNNLLDHPFRQASAYQHSIRRNVFFSKWNDPLRDMGATEFSRIMIRRCRRLRPADNTSVFLSLHIWGGGRVHKSLWITTNSEHDFFSHKKSRRAAINDF